MIQCIGFSCGVRDGKIERPFLGYGDHTEVFQRPSVQGQYAIRLLSRTVDSQGEGVEFQRTERWRRCLVRSGAQAGERKEQQQGFHGVGVLEGGDIGPPSPIVWSMGMFMVFFPDRQKIRTSRVFSSSGMA